MVGLPDATIPRASFSTATRQWTRCLANNPDACRTRPTVMKNPLKVAVIGVGHMGRNHARIYGELDGCELVAVVDKDLDRAREIAAQFGGQAFSRFADVTTPAVAATLA